MFLFGRNEVCLCTPDSIRAWDGKSLAPIAHASRIVVPPSLDAALSAAQARTRASARKTHVHKGPLCICPCRCGRPW